MVIFTLISLSTSYQINSQLNKPSHPPKTVDYVDIDKYVGVWYQQSAIPHNFQHNCTDTMATYTKQGKGIKVNNTGIRKDGKPSTIIGAATPQDETNSKLKLRFSILMPYGQYWIVRLGKEYQYAVISDPNYDYLYILSRDKHFDQNEYNRIYEDLKSDGFQVDKLKKTIQH